MKEKVWYEVKVNGETLAKIKSQGLAYHVKQLFEKIYVSPPPPCANYETPVRVTVE